MPLQADELGIAQHFEKMLGSTDVFCFFFNEFSIGLQAMHLN